jgi:hypothetical protein
MLAVPTLAVTLFVLIPNLWAHEFGRMTGGGSILLGPQDFVRGQASAVGTRVTHGFELHCGQNEPVRNQPPVEPNNLQINIHTPDGRAGSFHLEQIDFALCRSGEDPAPPQAPFYWYEGEGTGRFNGESGYFAQWVFTDVGEPGKSDRIYWLSINQIGGPLIVQVVGPGHTLTFGNHQAHRSTGSKQ